MPSLREVCDLLDSWFRFADFPDDEGNGLAAGGEDRDRPVRTVGYAVNSAFEVVEDAANQGVDLLLTHHAIWDAVDLGLAEHKRVRLRERRIAHYACHLPLDCDDRGTAATLCAHLGITIQGAFADVGGGQQAGRWGMLPSSISLNAFVARLSDALHVAPYVLLGSGRVQQIGIVTGAGGQTNWLEEARALGCDTFVTGEGSLFTKLYARETGLNLLLGTHVATERPGIEALARRLQSALPGVEIVGLRETPFE